MATPSEIEKLPDHEDAARKFVKVIRGLYNAGPGIRNHKGLVEMDKMGAIIISAGEIIPTLKKLLAGGQQDEGAKAQLPPDYVRKMVARRKQIKIARKEDEFKNKFVKVPAVEIISRREGETEVHLPFRTKADKEEFEKRIWFGDLKNYSSDIKGGRKVFSYWSKTDHGLKWVFASANRATAERYYREVMKYSEEKIRDVLKDYKGP